MHFSYLGLLGLDDTGICCLKKIYIKTSMKKSAYEKHALKDS